MTTAFDTERLASLISHAIDTICNQCDQIISKIDDLEARLSTIEILMNTPVANVNVGIKKQTKWKPSVRYEREDNQIDFD